MWLSRPIYSAKVKNIGNGTVVVGTVSLEAGQESIVQFYDAEDLRSGWGAHLRGLVEFVANADGTTPLIAPTPAELRGDFTLNVLDDVSTTGISNGQTIVYSETSETWSPGDVGSGGGSGTGSVNSVNTVLPDGSGDVSLTVDDIPTLTDTLEDHGIRITSLENKSNTIFTTFEETFDTANYVDSATDAIRESGYMRAKFSNVFQDDFLNSNSLVMPNEYAYVDPADDSLKFKTPTLAERTIDTTFLPGFLNTSQISLTTNVNFNARLGYYETGNVLSTYNVRFVAACEVTPGQTWTFFYNNTGASATGGLYMVKPGGVPEIIFTSASLINETLNSRIAVTYTQNNIFVFSNTTNRNVSIFRIAISSGQVIPGREYNVSLSANSASCRVLDALAVNNDQIYFLYSTSNNDTDTHNAFVVSVFYQQSDNSWNYTGGSSILSSASSLTHSQGRLSFDSTASEVYVTVFRITGNTGVYFTKFSVVQTGITFQNSAFLSIPSSGAGTVVYNNGFLYIFSIRYVVDSEGNIYYRSYNVSTNTLSGSLFTATTPIVSGIEAVLVSNQIHVLYCAQGALFQDLDYGSRLGIAKYSVSGSNITQISNQTFKDDGINTFNNITAYGHFQGSPSFKIITSTAEPAGSTTCTFAYNLITPTLQVRVMNTSSISTTVGNITPTNSSVVFQLAGTYSQFKLRFTTRFIELPLAENPIAIDWYKVESLTPSTSFPQSAFISEPVIEGRVIDSIMLEPNQDTVYGDINWEASAKDGVAGSWFPVTNFTGFQDIHPSLVGTKLRLKADFIPQQNITNVNDVPKIFSYAVSTKNIVTMADLFPLQVNMMKMGLKINTYGTMQATGFVNMMIDLFDLEPSNINSNINSGQTTMTYDSSNKYYYSTGGGAKAIVSKPETTDNGIFPVKFILVVDEVVISNATYQVRRNNEGWESIIPNTLFIFPPGTNQGSNTIEVRAVIDGTITGWAYLYQ
jgi:hypothetical protein